MTSTDKQSVEKVEANGKTPAQLPYGTSEKDELLMRQEIDPKRASQLRRSTIVVCVISVIVTACVGGLTLATAFIENSTASFAFSFSAILDSLTSVVVIWRYCGTDESVYSMDKERRACFWLGVLFIISFFTTFSKSVHALATKSLPGRDHLTWYVAIMNTIVCTALAVAKFYLAAQLNSRSIFTDGVNSAIGTVLASAIIASSVVYDTNKRVWFLDALVGVICAIFLLLYGVRLLWSGRSVCLRRLHAPTKEQVNGQYEMMDKQ